MPEQVWIALVDFSMGMLSGGIFAACFNAWKKRGGGDPSLTIPPIRMLFWGMLFAAFVASMVWIVLLNMYTFHLIEIYLLRTLIIIVGTGLGASFVHWLCQRN